MRTGAALYATTTVSGLTAVATTHVLRSPQLKSLLQKNSERLGHAYALLTNMLREHGIEYFPANAGLYVFVRIAPHARDWEDEAAAVLSLKDHGVLVSGGRGYHTPGSCKGWARVGFAMPQEKLIEAISRMARFFSALGGTNSQYIEDQSQL